MKRSRGTSAIICVLGLVLPALPASAQDLTPDPEGFIIAGPDDLIPPDGERRIAILGDPNEPGPYVIRITFEPGQGSRPHFHDQGRPANRESQSAGCDSSDGSARRPAGRGHSRRVLACGLLMSERFEVPLLRLVRTDDGDLIAAKTCGLQQAHRSAGSYHVGIDACADG
jgi:hypothetical protein